MKVLKIMVVFVVHDDEWKMLVKKEIGEQKGLVYASPKISVTLT